MLLNESIEVVYGGTFDPFHRAHEAACDHFLSHPFVKRLRLVPCFLPALKTSARASAADRLAMLNVWRTQHTEATRIVVDAREIDRGSTSYTAETLRSLQAEDPKTIRVFALGSDAFNTLNRWFQADWLLEHVRFWVLTRAQSQPVNTWPTLTPVAEARQLFYSAQGCFYVDDSVNLALSSTQIRQQGVTREWVPASVYAYIMKYSLY